MSKETRDRIAFRMQPETRRRIEQWYAADNCQSKNEFIEKAVNFYVDYLGIQDNTTLLPMAIMSAIDGRLSRLEDYIACRDFTRCVEQDMTNGIIAEAFEMDREDLKRRRAQSVRNVKATNGLISLESTHAPARSRTGMMTNGKTDPQESLYQKHRRGLRIPSLHRDPGAGGAYPR